MTEVSRAGDTVIYVGGSVGSYVVQLAQMFPELQFRLFDHNTSNCIRQLKEAGTMPMNLEHHVEVFSDQVFFYSHPRPKKSASQKDLTKRECGRSQPVCSSKRRWMAAIRCSCPSFGTSPGTCGAGDTWQ